jgi:1-acyl-sn-glycerol-3-phosphate acyltransferase
MGTHYLISLVQDRKYARSKHLYASIRLMNDKLLALLFIAYIGISSIFFFFISVLIYLISYPFDKKLSLLHLFTCFWSTSYLWIFPLWKLKVEGRDKISKDQTYIYVSNHQSLVDILAAFSLFTHFKWVSKGELFTIPFIGWNMYLNRYVRLKRGKKSNTRRLYRACERHLKRGSSVYIFPEGSRSSLDQPRSFREGAFVLAKRHNIPILPIAILGTKDALSNTWKSDHLSLENAESAENDILNRPKRASMEVKVLDPILPDEALSAQEMAQLARNQISQALKI